MTGESPTRPQRLPVRPPVEVAAARCPLRSSATAPTVPWRACGRSRAAPLSRQRRYCCQRSSVWKYSGSHLLQALFPREGVGAVARQHHVRGLLHHGAREAHRIPRARDAGDRAGAARAAVHDRGVELVAALGAEHRALAGIEQRIVLEHTHRGFHRIEAGPAGLEHARAGGQRRIEAGAVGGFLFGCEVLALHDAGAAMHGQGPFPARVHRRGRYSDTECHDHRQRLHRCYSRRPGFRGVSMPCLPARCFRR